MFRRVVTQPSRPVRARNAEEKQQRRGQILASAERLWQVTSYGELSMNQVAREASLAKGTLYLYFDTKEELFLALLTEHLNAWFEEFERLASLRPPQNGDDIADLLIQLIGGHEPLRRLLLLLGTVLERNVQPESVRRFYRGLRQKLPPVITRLPLRPDQTMYLLMQVHALVVGWHQVAETNMQMRMAEAYGLPKEYQRPSFEQGFGFAVRAVIKEIEGLSEPL